MGSARARSKALALMLANRAAALATNDAKGKPHVAVVYCCVAKDLSVYFSTRTESRKFRNMQRNSFVAMDFFNEQELASVQLTGRARRVTDLAEEQRILATLLEMRHDEPNWEVPVVRLFEEGATNEIAVIKVKPTEMTLASFVPREDGRYQPIFTKVI